MRDFATMSQSILDSQSQEQNSVIKDTNVSGDLTYAPVQIGTKIETLIVESSLEKVTQRELNKKSPYQGLKRFNFKDRDRFFGRDKLITRLFKAVNRSSLSLVLGASGSGKSSVVRAGLIPEMKKSLESQTLYDFIFTPDQDPFDSLYRCLLSEEKDYNFSKAQAEIALEAKAGTLSKVISTLKKDEERWLIFVDQFEELFTICDDQDKRKNFISSLVQVAKSGNSSVNIVLAMRSDFLEQFSFYPDLGAIANQNNIHLVTEMYPDELRQAIEQPAARHGVVFEEGLVKQIIEEVEGQKGYLPLLQYTLNVLWESECQTLGADGRPDIEDRTLNKKSYSALEGVRGALQKRVNEIYSNLNQDQQITTKQIFLKLVNIVDTGSVSREVSRRAYRDEFVGESVENLLKKFIDENLLVSSSEYSSTEEMQESDSKPLKQSATVEIAHEILLSSWDELKRWLEQEKEAIILKNWLTGETKRWQKIRSEDESKAQDELLKGSRLAQFVEFKKKDAFKNVGGLSKQEEEFINASVEWHEREKKRKFTSYSITGLVVISLVLIAMFLWQRATKSQQEGYHVLEFVGGNLILNKAGDLGSMKILGDSNTWKVMKQIYNNETSKYIPFAMFRDYGNGKVIAVAHERIFYEPNSIFVGSAFSWLNQSRNWLNLSPDQKKVLISSGHCETASLRRSPVLLPSDLKTNLENWKLGDEVGYEVNTITAPLDETKLREGNILIIGNAWGNFTQSEIDAVEKFVRNGGSLLVAGFGGSWRQYGAQKNFTNPEKYGCTQDHQNVKDISTYPMNRLVKPYKMEWGPDWFQVPVKNNSQPND